MGELILVLGWLILDAGVAASIVSGIGSLAMVATRQPSRRRALARVSVLGTLGVVPLVCLRPFVPIDLLGPIRLALVPVADRFSVSSTSWPHWAIGIVRLLPFGLLTAYATWVVFGLIRLAIGALGAGWIRRNSHRPSAEVEALYGALAFVTGRPRPKLRVSPRVTRPVLLGMFRPTVLIPPDLERPESAGPLRLALLHELAHAEASDPWFGLACEVASIVWFWLPPLRWIGRQMALDQELLADRGASDRLGTPAHYASTLVEFASGRRSQGDRPAAADGSALLHRVLMLIRCPFPVEPVPPRWWRGMLGVATTLILLLATGFSLRARTLSVPSALPGPELRNLSLPQVVLEASNPAAPDVTLPIRLPDDFDLTFEVVSDLIDLSRIQVLGHPLSSVQAPLSLLLPDAPRVHHVSIHRRAGTISLTLDSGAATTFPGESTEGWLVTRGVAGKPTVLRSIRLTW